MENITFIFTAKIEQHFDMPWNSLFSQNNDRAHKGHSSIRVMLIIMVILGKE